MLAVAVASPGTVAAATPLPAADDAVAPLDTLGLDPVLDGVAVKPTAALRTADARLDRVAAARREALMVAVAAAEERATLVQRALAAEAAVAESERAQVRAVAAERAATVELARRRSVEADRRRALATEQQALRQLAAAVFTSAPADDLTFLADWDDISASSRRDALRDRGIDEQSARVEAARRPWAAAVGRRRAGERDLRAARAAIARADRRHAEAIDLRDHQAAVLAEAQQRTEAAQRALARADAAVQDAARDRREVRLTLLVSGTDLPLVALDAYWRAAARSPCGVPWWVLAGIGRSETHHGTAFGSRPNAVGDTPFTILGVRLDGHPGVAAVADSDGGRLDQDPLFDRAVGPMQFLPGTWNRWAADGNADHRSDPNNLYDAALAAADYLCFRRPGPLAEADLTSAILTYNRSLPYAASVLARGRAYRDDLDLPDRPPPR